MGGHCLACGREDEVCVCDEKIECTLCERTFPPKDLYTIERGKICNRCEGYIVRGCHRGSEDYVEDNPTETQLLRWDFHALARRVRSLELLIR